MIQDTLKKPKRKNYSDEFKEFLVQEAISSGRSIASIARDNGINQNLLHNWKRQNRAKIIQAPENTLPAITHEPSTPSNFIPITLDSQQSFNSASLAIATIQSVQLQIPTRHTSPIRLSIEQIDTRSLIELLRGLQWYKSPKSGYPPLPWTCEVAVTNSLPTSSNTTKASNRTVPTYFTT